MSEVVNKYSNGKIYTVRCLINPDLIYVGSCTQPLTKRFSGHKSCCKKGASISLYKHIIDNDWSNWHIELHEYYPCNNREELNRREGEVIREIGTINKNVAGRNKKESQKNWVENNREHCLEKQKEWRENNPEHMKIFRENNPDYMKNWVENNPDYMKEYYKNNREHILAKQKEYRSRKRSATP